MKTLEQDLADLVRQWRADSREQHSAASRLSGRERACAETHANTKEAAANALQRLMYSHGMGAAQSQAKTTGAKR